MVDSRVIHFWSKFTNSNKFSLWIWNLLELDPFNLYIENILTKLFQLLINTNPRSMSLKNESILFTRAPSWSCTIYIATLKKWGFSSGTEQTMSSQEHPHSYIINIKKMVDVRIHSRPYPSSRTLLSTTSF